MLSVLIHIHKPRWDGKLNKAFPAYFVFFVNKATNKPSEGKYLRDLVQFGRVQRAAHAHVCVLRVLHASHWDPAPHAARPLRRSHALHWRRDRYGWSDPLSAMRLLLLRVRVQSHLRPRARRRAAKESGRP